MQQSHVETTRLLHNTLQAPSVQCRTSKTRTKAPPFVLIGTIRYSYRFDIQLQVAIQYGLCQPRKAHMDLEEVLAAHLELPRVILPGPINYTQVICNSFVA